MPKTIAKRKQIPAKVLAEVLIKCRRRCCLCYFWDGNSTQQPGQIAHIDRDSSNNFVENLAYLCFSHHNLYDSNQQQGKNVTIDELRHARDQLNNALNPKLAFIVTLRLNCDDDEDEQNAVENLMQLLRTTTDSEDIDLLDVRRGSLLVTVRLNAEQTRKVFEELDSVPFDALGVTDATIDHVEEFDVLQTENHIAEAVAMVRERTAVLESTVASSGADLKELMQRPSEIRELRQAFRLLENRVDRVEHYVEEIVGDLHRPVVEDPVNVPRAHPK